MAYTVAAENAALDGIGAAATWISAHTADPGSTGTNEVTGGGYARVQTTWSPAAGSSKTGSTAVLNIPAGTTVTHWGLWSSNSGGTFYYGGDSTDESYSSTGQYGVTPTLTASG
jgi:hypothetical protein